MFHKSNDIPPVPVPPPVPDDFGDDTHVQKTVVIANSRAAAARRRRARRNLILIIAGAAVVGVGAWMFTKYSVAPIAKVASFENQVTSAVQQSIASFPTTGVTSTKSAAAKITQKQSVIDAEGVIADTNEARAENGGLPALTENSTLDDVAMLRLDDMFTNQYFAHIDPTTGQSATSVAASVGYSYLAMGENLAEGFFAGDQGVVTAWMNSPGHRANILDAHYTEIGVAAREGTLNGQNVWIAVQVFGKPTSACPPSPDPVLEQAINAAEQALTDMNEELTQENASITAMLPPSGDAYNAAVAQYNGLVNQYNGLAAQTKTEVNQYNGQVDAYNACL